MDAGNKMFHTCEITTRTEGIGWSVVNIDRAERVFSTYSICEFDGASPTKSEPLVISAAHTFYRAVDE